MVSSRIMETHLRTGPGMQEQAKARRPLKSRGTFWASALTRLLLKTSITANQVSVLGIVAAAIGAAAFVFADERAWLWLIAALCIQLRLLANMMDGLVAGNRGSPTGPLFNELPDRLQDSLLLISAGYASGLDWLGWLAALLAAMTAYVRAVGTSLGQQPDFRGPMAKPHRMAALTLGALASFAAVLAEISFPVMHGDIGHAVAARSRHGCTVAERVP
jgi:phosphatidylglycerophosphate synthase